MTSVSNQKDTHVSATVENIKTKMTKSLKRQNDTNESKGMYNIKLSIEYLTKSYVHSVHENMLLFRVRQPETYI